MKDPIRSAFIKAARAIRDEIEGVDMAVVEDRNAGDAAVLEMVSEIKKRLEFVEGRLKAGPAKGGRATAAKRK